ncbi:LysE family transporter [Pokkaliibacter sp. MBI-7]|uniref:LysE family translocator n=1 Tax=Pokkaliibacter sp. MBI-7 TaxID=3040600 RepID=UPI00244BC696|nr:LysE family transporter [Pokkaliibacter sp. MBI-7]MDH2432605.1 LysE family transporter [Pokkaliibacter sp. MBI-7]
MLDVFAYAIGIMYSPGPVNFLALNAGLHGQGRQTLGFCVGVGFGIFIPLLAFSLLGAGLITPARLTLISALGCLYIAYLGVKIAIASLRVEVQPQSVRALSGRDGMLMQLLNPKGLAATLPLATIHLPAIGAHGSQLLLLCGVLAVLAGGAPLSYALAGAVLGKRLQHPGYLRLFNMLMAALLLFAAGSLAYKQVYLGQFG